jgi:hypothetical protein
MAESHRSTPALAAGGMTFDFPLRAPAMTIRLDPYVPFSVREKIGDAILGPGQFVKRAVGITNGQPWQEDEISWQTRAALEAVKQCVASSPSFAAWLRLARN